MPPVQCARLVILIWAIIWVIAAPLFHIHIPDTTDQWSALQSGGAHTVLTPDLLGEFSKPFHSSHQGHWSDLAQRVVNSPELSVVLISESSDDRKTKALLNILSTSNFSPNTIQVSSFLFGFPVQSVKLDLFPPFPVSLRAPPPVVLL